jgi:hypothetical protein
MAMSFLTVSVAIAMVSSVFLVQSTEISVARSSGRRAEVEKGALVVGGSHDQLEDDQRAIDSIKGRKKDVDEDDKEDEEKDEKAPSPAKESDKKTSEDAEKTTKKGSEDDKKKEKDDEDEEEDEDDKKADDLESQLSAVRIEKREHESELKSFQDDNGFAKQLAADVESIGNETQSFALARFLGSLKASQRQFAKVNYEEFLKEEIEKADKKITKLEKALDKAEDESDKKDDEKDKAKKVHKISDKEEKKTAEEMGLPTKQSSGATFAIAFFANVAMLALVFAMASASHKTVSNYTWFLIDQTVAIFLAVMHFQAFDSLLSFSDMGVGDEVACAIFHTLCLLTLVLTVAYFLRKQKLGMAILCGAGAHFVSFSSIHSSALLQNKVFVAYSHTVTFAVLGLCVLALGLGMICFLARHAKKRAETEGDGSFDGYVDKTDDLENDMCATAFSVVFTMLIRFMLTGHHPDDDETEFDHTARQRAIMLCYACLCLVIGAVGIVVLARKAKGASYATKRICDFLSTVLAMNVAWAFLYWGEWEFFETLYANDPIKGRVMFAVTVTLIGGFLLIGLASLPESVGNRRIDARVKTLTLTALGLVIAFSWELTFDSAVEQMVEGRAHPIFLKVLSCVVMLAIIVPVYALYMKPITMKAQEELEGDAEPEKKKDTTRTSESEGQA